mgnify:CR=1 FL=1
MREPAQQRFDILSQIDQCLLSLFDQHLLIEQFLFHNILQVSVGHLLSLFYQPCFSPLHTTNQTIGNLLKLVLDVEHVTVAARLISVAASAVS